MRRNGAGARYGGAVACVALIGGMRACGATSRITQEKCHAKQHCLALYGPAGCVVAPEWRASFPAVRALRRDRRLSIDWSVGGAHGESAFRLVGSSDVLQQILNNC